MGEANRRGTAPERVQQASASKYAGLLGLATAITGTEVYMNAVQILDPEPFGKISSWMMRGLTESVRNKSLQLDSFKTAGWVQDDGSLTIRLIHKDAVNDEFRVPQEKWRMVTAEILEQATKNFDSPKRVDLINQLVSHAKKLAEASQPEVTEIDELVDSVVIVIGREPAGIHFLNFLAKDKADLCEAADGWLADSAKYFVIPLDKKTGFFVDKTELAKAESELMQILFHSASDHERINRIGLSMVGVSADTQQIAHDYWSSRGGKVVTRK